MKKRVWLTGVVLSLLAVTFVSCKQPAPVSDTVRWINTTYALLTEANRGDRDLIGGFKKTELNQEQVRTMLSEWWDVTDRATADENLDWLLSEGHRTVFQKDMADLEEAGLTDLSSEELRSAAEDAGYTDEAAAWLVAMVELYRDKGSHAIDAWDYCRALQVLGYYYVAGYYTEEETLDASLEVAKTLQGMYGSWDECMESYLAGYQYWQEDDAQDPDSATAARRKIYEELQADDENPYELDWNTSLVKTW